MANDFKTILTVDNKQFVVNIKSAEKTFKNFSQGVEGSKSSFKTFESSMGTLAGTVSKFAGGLGVAMSAYEGINKFLNSNAKLQDDYREAMQAGKKVTDQFFSSLYSGDWTVFDKGITNAIKKAREFVAAYRDTQRMLEVTGIRYEQTDSRKNQLESIIEDDTKPLEERKKAQQELDRILIMGVADIREAARITEAELNKMIGNTVGGNKYINPQNAQKLILDLRDPYSELSNQVSQYREMRDAKDQLWNPNVFKYSGDEWAEINKKASEAYYREYTREQRAYYDELIRLSDAMNDELFKSFQELFDRINDLNDKAGTWEKDRTGARDEIMGALTNSNIQNASEKSVPNIEGSIADLDKQLAEWREKFNNATTDEARLAADKVIREIESRKIILEVTVRYKQEGEEPTQKTSAQGQLPVITQTPDMQLLNKQLQAYKESIPENGIKIFNTDDSQIQSLTSMASLLGSINTLTGEGASGWLSYASTVMQAIAQMIQQINALATAQSQAAVANTVAGVTSIPFGWLMAGAAVASVIAAMAQAPKFATGGIVPGTSYYGDRVPIMANSGELILNKVQQGNLFRMLNEGGAYGRGSEIHVTGEFVTRGSNLVATIKNYEKSISRTR